MTDPCRTSVTRDPAVVALLQGRADYPGPVAILDAADRAWLRERGVAVPERAATVPLHEHARQARLARQAEEARGAKKKNRGQKKEA